MIYNIDIRRLYMGKGQEKSNKNNKQKLTPKEKAEKKKAKKEGKK
jgi:hypothetical protein